MWTSGYLEKEGWWWRFLEHPLFLPNNQKKVTHPTALPLAILPLKTLPWSPSQRLEFFSVSHPFSLLSPGVNLVVANSCLTLYDPMDCLTQGLPVPHHLPEFSQVHVHCILDAIQVTLFSFCLQSSPASESFSMSWLFTSGGQSIGASASASVLPKNGQCWFPLGLTGLIPLLSKGLSRVFSSTIV